jgi:hypothetical protein
MHPPSSIICPPSALPQDYNSFERPALRSGLSRWLRGCSPALVVLGLWLLGTSAASAYDHGNTLSTATAVNVPSTTGGAIHFAGDQDYFRFTIVSTQNITASSTGSTDTFGDLMDANGTVLASNDDANGSTNFYIARQLNAGTYYLRVRHYSSGVASGTYQLVLSGSGSSTPGLTPTPAPTPVADDHGNSTSNATFVGVPSTTGGAIHFAGDQDYFRFTVTGTQNITASSTGSTDTFGDLMDAAGAVLASNDDANGSTNFYIARQLNAGIYYLRVRHYSSAAVSGSYQVVLSGSASSTPTPTPVPTPVADDHGNSSSSATLVSVPSTTGGAIHFAGDHDYFRFTITGTQNFTASSTGSTDTFGDLMDATGAVLVSNDDANGSRNFYIARQLNAGIYFVRVRHYSLTATSGAYQLVLGGSVPVNTQAIRVLGNNVEIANGDTSPSVTDFTDFGQASFLGGYVDRTFQIRNAGATVLVLTGNPAVVITGAFASDFSVISQPPATLAPGGMASFTVRYLPSTSGGGVCPATISIASSDPNRSLSTYAIQGRSTANVDDVGNNYASASVLSPFEPSSISVWSVLNYGGDLDYFRFTLNSPRKLRIRTFGYNGSNPDTYGFLYNQGYVALAGDDNSGGEGHFLIEKSLPAGTYYLRLSGANVSITGSYRLFMEVVP